MNCRTLRFGRFVCGLVLLVTLFIGLAVTADASSIGCAVGGGNAPTGWTISGGSVGGGLAATAPPFIGPGTAATDCYIVTDTGGGYPGTIPTTFFPSGSSTPGIPNTTNGSQMVSPAFTAKAGQQLNFNFMFATNDGTGEFSDWANAALVPTTAGPAINLFTARTGASNQVVPGFGFPTLPPGLVLTPATSSLIADTWFLDGLTGGTSSADLNATQYGPCRYPTTGPGCDPGGSSQWVNAVFTFDATDAGSYQLVMNVANVGDEIYSSALFFNGQSISSGVITPEPATWSLVGLGLVGFLVRRRRKPSGMLS